MRQLTVLIAAAVFAFVWMCNICAPLVGVLMTTVFLESEGVRLGILGIGLVLFVVLAAAYAVGHWASGWPLGGWGWGRGSRAWTLALVGGVLVLMLGMVVPITGGSPAARHAIAMVGAPEGPTVIYTPLAVPPCNLMDLLPFLIIHATACLAVLCVARRAGCSAN